MKQIKKLTFEGNELWIGALDFGTQFDDIETKIKKIYSALEATAIKVNEIIDILNEWNDTYEI